MMDAKTRRREENVGSSGFNFKSVSRNVAETQSKSVRDRKPPISAFPHFVSPCRCFAAPPRLREKRFFSFQFFVFLRAFASSRSSSIEPEHEHERSRVNREAGRSALRQPVRRRPGSGR